MCTPRQFKSPLYFFEIPSTIVRLEKNFFFKYVKKSNESKMYINMLNTANHPNFGIPLIKKNIR